MQETERLFLSINQALDAVRIAFSQYSSQLNLLTVIWPMVFGDGAYTHQDGRNSTVWAKIPGDGKLILSSEDDLKQRILEQFQLFPPAPEHLARICSLVFGVHGCAGTGPAPDSAPGIWIDTDMAGFVCTRCGHCCRTLNYHDGCSLADYNRWLDLGRTDILDWVGTVRQNDRVIGCRIWMLPGTNRFAERCPWLARSSDRECYVCTIHDVRPAICRHYPGSRKHARMTGCSGV